MLKLFGGAHGQPDGTALHPEGSALCLPCRARRIPKTSLYAHPGLSYIAVHHTLRHTHTHAHNHLHTHTHTHTHKDEDMHVNTYKRTLTHAHKTHTRSSHFP